MPHSPFFRLVHDDDAKIAKGYTGTEKFFCGWIMVVG
jgi:hypothetical protein